MNLMSQYNWVSVLISGFVALGFGGAGIFLLASFLKNRRRAKASYQWPSVPGRIHSSTVIESRSTAGDSDRFTAPIYTPLVNYTYAVMGKTYQGEQIGFGTTVAGPRYRAAKLVARYPTGAAVPVHYNPENPAEAVLESNVQNQTAMLVMTLLFVAIGLTACVVSCGLIAGMF
jgi:hypothetical protein